MHPTKICNGRNVAVGLAANKMQKEEEESVQVLTKAGYTFTKPTPADSARAVEAMKPYWDDWAKSRGPEIVEALGKVRAALGK